MAPTSLESMVVMILPLNEEARRCLQLPSNSDKIVTIGQKETWHICLSLDDPPKTTFGKYVFGSGLECDVVLSDPSAEQFCFSIVLNPTGDLLLENNSDAEIGFGVQQLTKRNDVGRIVEGDAIQIHDSCFGLIFPKREELQEAYERRLGQYFIRTTPEMNWKEEQLATFGNIEVCRHTNLKTGQLFTACYWRTPSAAYEDPHAELKAIKRSLHPDIINLVDDIERIYERAIESGCPPCLSLDEVTLTVQGLKEVLRQCLQMLVHLHARGGAHGRINTRNIIIQSVQPLRVQVAFSAISTALEDPHSVMNGDLLYFAPETLLYGSPIRSQSADIWSLGVVIVAVAVGLPPSSIPLVAKSGHSDLVRGYFNELLLQVHTTDQSLRRLLLNMVRPDVKRRWSARKCLETLHKEAGCNSNAE